MSSTVTVTQGNTLNLNLSFTSATDGTPLNLSGYQVYYTAVQSLSATGTQLFNIGVTGGSGNITGSITIPLTSQDTNYCPGDYPSAITVSGNSTISSWNDVIFRIQPALLVLS